MSNTGLSDLIQSILNLVDYLFATLITPLRTLKGSIIISFNYFSSCNRAEGEGGGWGIQF